MFEPLKNRPTLLALAAAGLTALGVGGVAIAQSGGPAPSAQHENTAAEGSDNGDKADGPGDKADGPESSEVPNGDGPGGHAD